MHNYEAYKRSKTSRNYYFFEMIYEANINFKKKWFSKQVLTEIKTPPCTLVCQSCPLS